MPEKRPNKAQRREEAKRQRAAEIRRRARAQTMRKVRIALSVALLVGAVAGLVLFSSARGRQARNQLAALASTAGCGPLRSPPDLGRTPHLAANETFDYNSNPPTSGRHDPSPSQTGIHTDLIPDRNQVHNLEHGHVGIQYRDDLGALAVPLAQVVRSNSTRIFLAPRPELKAKLAFTAWDHLIACDNPNDGVVALAKEWVKQFAGKGPEGDLPGQPIGV